MMRDHIKPIIAFLLLIAVAQLSSLTPAAARGGGSNIMNSPGYQRALQESRQRQVEPYVKPPAVDPRKTWRHRGRRH